MAADAPPRDAGCGLFAAVGTLFSILLVIASLLGAASEARQQRMYARWPAATARITRCSFDATPNRSRFVRCQISYTAAGEIIHQSIRSHSAADAQLQRWIDAHPDGTQIVIRYDPAAPRMVFVDDRPLFGSPGPRLYYRVAMLSGALAAVFLVAFLVLSRRARSRREASR